MPVSNGGSSGVPEDDGVCIDPLKPALLLMVDDGVKILWASLPIENPEVGPNKEKSLVECGYGRPTSLAEIRLIVLFCNSIGDDGRPPCN